MLGKLASFKIWNNVATLVFWIAIMMGSSIVGAHIYRSLTRDAEPKHLVVHPLKVVKAQPPSGGTQK